jgi:hypothetical protein
VLGLAHRLLFRYTRGPTLLGRLRPACLNPCSLFVSWRVQSFFSFAFTEHIGLFAWRQKQKKKKKEKANKGQTNQPVISFTYQG